ncbi:MAG: GNAT family N-acetyltransferase [Chloroflexi bacterium]|nr:GNAT family N-acetyltransferase [Chloroflexota bacterium]
MKRTGGARPVFVAGLPEIDGLAVRRFDQEGDYARVAELLRVVNAHDGVDWLPTAETLRNDWTHSDGLDLGEDIIVAETGDVTVAYAEHSWRVRGGSVVHDLHVAVTPAARGRGLGRALLGWAEGRVTSGLAAGGLGADLGIPQVLSGWADLEIPGVLPWATAAGYQVAGYGLTMTRPLSDPMPDVELPPGLEVRPVRPEQHRAIWDADAEAFQDHRDPGLRTDADYEGWFSQPDLDTSLWLVAWDGDDVAGSVLNFVYAEENARLGVRRGWLEHVSVRRPWRRQGLASALITRSLRLLRALDLDEAALGSDAENLSGAVHIYEALGFRRARTAAHYRKPIEALDPGAPLPGVPRPGPGPAIAPCPDES